MLDVAARVRDQAGAVDILLGNLSENLWTPWRANGAGTYLFCYDKVTLSSTQHWPDATSMSLGIEGMVEVMTRVSARFFLPHSHRFREPGKPIETEKFSERALMANLQHGCVRRNIATKLVEWKVLDGFLANPDGTFSISSCVEGRP